MNEYTDEELRLVVRLSNVLEKGEKTRLSSFQTGNKGVLKREVHKMNHLQVKIRSDSIATTNNLIYAAAMITNKNADVKIKKAVFCWYYRMSLQHQKAAKLLRHAESLFRQTILCLFVNLFVSQVF